mgnify:CR=1 FL=1
MRLFPHSALLALCAAVGATASASTVISRSFHSEALGRDWSYTIYLPTGYRHDAPRIPVLYLLHGNNGDANDWLTQGRLQAAADTVMAETLALGGTGGVIVTGPNGEATWSFNTPGMYRGKVTSGTKRIVAIYGDEG